MKATGRGSPPSASKGAVTLLVDALRTLGLDGEIALGGRWVTLRGECCAVYVAQAATGGYFTWCDDPAERSVEAYRDPREAIVAGLRRATRNGGAIDARTSRLGAQRPEND
ncbi:MAG: hypothetical protein H0V00_05910 [Chloroflexia bacterium]|nr:hypothetical protein [Chloroflexia bacterium]